MACLECHSENSPTAKFCAECGRPLVRERAVSPESAAERRQLTVMFCDLVGSTALSEQLDPEELHVLVRTYQEVCAQVVRRFDGYIAQYLGDGLLIYFGYPAAHEDDAVRAVRTGLAIVEALQKAIHIPTPQNSPVQVRIGMHTGQVVVGDVGGRDHREQLALGETPNIAARIQNLAEPNTVVISAATYRLVRGLFECQARGAQAAKGLSAPIEIFQVLAPGRSQSRFEMAIKTGLTPLVGRQEEMALLTERWQQAKAGLGQIVLLSGEPGIGKSRLVQELKRQVQGDSVSPLLVPFGRRVEYRCSPNYQHSALYPVIELLTRLFQFGLDDTPHVKIGKVEHALKDYQLPLREAVPLFAALLSLPLPEQYTPLSFSPQKQKEKILHTLIAWLLEEARRRPVLLVWEDLHWADPSTLELVERIIPQVETAPLLMLVTFRSEFEPPWPMRTYMTALSLDRLASVQTEEMVANVVSQKILPAELVQQLVAKTDGIPLFIEELTKMVIDSGVLQNQQNQQDQHGQHGQYQLSARLPPLAIPATLQDSLMARLDQLAPVREIAQLAASLGREFSYRMIQAIAPVDETILQHSLALLVQKELLYQKGQPPQAYYYFKHALIRDTAYQSMLKSKRQHVHQQIAQVLEERFADTLSAQPEIIAHHYTEAGLASLALPYWRRAGQQAAQRSANQEAIHHLQQGLALLASLPDSPERQQHELRLQLALGSPLIASRGYAAPEVEQTYTRTQQLCQQLGETPQLFQALWGLLGFWLVRGQLQTAHALTQQMLTIAEQTQHPILLTNAQFVSGQVAFHRGDLRQAQRYLENSIAGYRQQARHLDPSLTVQDPGVASLSYLAMVVWLLGYPDQALARATEAVKLAEELNHPLSICWALNYQAGIHRFRREKQACYEQARAAAQLASEYGLPFWVTMAEVVQNWADTAPGRVEKQIDQIRQSLANWRAMGTEIGRSNYLGLLAELYLEASQPDAALEVVIEALAAVEQTGETWYEAELYRLKAESLLRNDECGMQNDERQKQTTETSSVHHSSFIIHRFEDAEVCLQQALAIARNQEARSLELRVAVSLAQLWERQGKLDAALPLLTALCRSFEEGQGTADWQDANALIAKASTETCPMAPQRI